MRTRHMKGRNLLRALLLATAFAMCVTGNAATSDPTLVFVRPAESSFWRTATNASFTVNIDYPEGATAAELTVKGMHFAVTVPNVTARQCDLTLPKATSPETEDVFDLILEFDNGVTNVASVGVIQGSGVAEPVTTRVLSSGTLKWGRSKGSDVLPIPSPTATLSIDGEPVETGVGIGWHGWQTKDFGTHVLRLEDGAAAVEALVEVKNGGLILIVR